MGFEPSISYSPSRQLQPLRQGPRSLRLRPDAATLLGQRRMNECGSNVGSQSRVYWAAVTDTWILFLIKVAHVETTVKQDKR